MEQVALQMRINRGTGRSDDRRADAARLRVDAERVVDGPLFGFGLRSGAHVQDAPVRQVER